MRLAGRARGARDELGRALRAARGKRQAAVAGHRHRAQASGAGHRAQGTGHRGNSARTKLASSTEAVCARTLARDRPRSPHRFDRPHTSSMRGYGGFEEFIRSQGGIVARHELLAAGWTADELRIAYGNYGRPTRLRRGWYCSSEVPAVVRHAWKHGGPLACVSALQWHGVLPGAGELTGGRETAGAGESGGPGDSSTLHICLPRHTHRRRVEVAAPLHVVRHWHDSSLRLGNRWAVPIEVALEQQRWCTAR